MEKRGISVKMPVSLLSALWFRPGPEINVNVPLGCPGASPGVRVELWCSQKAAALISPTAAVVLHTREAAESPAAPGPSVTDLQSLPEQRGSG